MSYVVTSYELRITNYELRITNYKLQITSSLIMTSAFEV